MWLKLKKNIGKQFEVQVQVQENLPDIPVLNGYVNNNYDFAVKFLPKCGSTSVLRMLYELENSVLYSRELEGGFVHEWAKRKKYGSMSSVSRRIVIIRDPVKRLLSAYLNKVATRKVNESYIKEKFPSVFAKIKYFNPTFEQFIDEFALYREIPMIKQHTMPICELLYPYPLDFFSDVIPMEQFSMLEKIMSDIFHCNAMLGHHQTSGRKIRLQDISEQHLNKVLNFYTEDYKYLSDYYTKDQIIQQWKMRNN